MGFWTGLLPLLRYPLNDEKFKQIRDETESRKLATLRAHHEKLEDFITPDHKM
jgi:hypothetical protein